MLFRSLTNSNGRIVAYFDGVNDYLKAASFPLVQPTSVFMGVKQVTHTDGDRIFDGDLINYGAVFSSAPSPNISIYAGESIAAVNTGLSLGSFKVASLIFNGATSSTQVGLAAKVAGNSGTRAMGGFTLAAAGGAPATLFSNIETSDILVFQGAPSEAWQRYNILGLARLNGVNPFAP